MSNYVELVFLRRNIVAKLFADVHRELHVNTEFISCLSTAKLN